MGWRKFVEGLASWTSHALAMPIPSHIPMPMPCQCSWTRRIRLLPRRAVFSWDVAIRYRSGERFSRGLDIDRELARIPVRSARGRGAWLAVYKIGNDGGQGPRSEF